MLEDAYAQMLRTQAVHPVVMRLIQEVGRRTRAELDSRFWRNNLVIAVMTGVLVGGFLWLSALTEDQYRSVLSMGLLVLLILGVALTQIQFVRWNRGVRSAQRILAVDQEMVTLRRAPAEWIKSKELRDAGLEEWITATMGDRVCETALGLSGEFVGTLGELLEVAEALEADEER